VHAEPAATHPPEFDNVADHPAYQIHGDGKTDALRAKLLCKYCGVDADEIAIGVDQRTAGIAEIDGSVGLDEVGKGHEPQAAAADGADDSLRYGLTQSERVADGQHNIACPQLIGTTHRHHGKIRQVDPQHGKIRVRIRADDGGLSD